MYCKWCQQISNFLLLRKFFQLNFLLLSHHLLLSYAILLKSLFFLSLYLLLQLLFFLHLLLILFLFFFATYFSFSSTTARSLTPSSYPPPPSHLHLILLFLLPSCSTFSYLPQRLLCLIHSPSYYRISTFPVTSSCPSTTSSFSIPIHPTSPPPLP